MLQQRRVRLAVSKGKGCCLVAFCFLASDLHTPRPIGFDLEWYKNEHIPVATVQLSDPEHIFVIQICAKEMTGEC